VAAAGLCIGILSGLFGVGGSSFATPVLGLLGVGGVVAVASPLPAVIPAALVGAATYLARRQVDWAVARWCIYGGLPGAVIGAFLSDAVGGRTLLALSGVVLAVIGGRILLPQPERRLAGRVRRRPGVVVPAAVVIGVFTGLLANGGGFLLVPLFVLVLGLTMPQSAGTSLIVIVVLSLPTVAAHWALGHIDWSVTWAFSAGAIPGAGGGAGLAACVRPEAVKGSFGVLLVVFGSYFVARQILGG
jgi:uncharacterized membrane protein YfcA